MSSGKVLSQASIYGLGIVVRNIAGFAMLPIYTRFLTPADYGVIEMLSMILDVVGLLLGIRIGEGIFRFYCATDDELEKRLTVSTALILTFAMNLFGLAFLLTFSSATSSIMLGDASYSWLLSLFFGNSGNHRP